MNLPGIEGLPVAAEYVWLQLKGLIRPPTKENAGQI